MQHKIADTSALSSTLDFKGWLRHAILSRLAQQAGMDKTTGIPDGTCAFSPSFKNASDFLAACFDPLVVQHDGACIRIQFPHAFFAPWYGSQAKSCLEAIVRHILGEQVNFAYSLVGHCPPLHGTDLAEGRDRLPAANPTLATDSTDNSATEVPLYAALAPQYNYSSGGYLHLHSHKPAPPDFGTYLAGAKNEFSLTVMQGMASGDTKYIPLLLRGTSGTGKTHLLRATASALAHVPGSAVYCLNARDFAELFRQPKERQDFFRTTLRTCSALFLDDVHLLVEDTLAQKELITLLDVLLDLRCPILCTADLGRNNQTADSLENLVPALFSRLCMGMVLILAEPDLDVRLRYAQAGLANLGMNPPQAIPLLLARSCTNLRHLQGVIQRMAAFHDHTGMLPDENDMDIIFRSSGSAQGMTPETILALVATRCGYTQRDIRGKKRDPKLVQARQIAMYLCRELLGESYPSLGQIFGGKDHSTVMHAVKKIRKAQLENKDMHILVTELTQRCRKARP